MLSLQMWLTQILYISSSNNIYLFLHSLTHSRHTLIHLCVYLRLQSWPVELSVPEAAEGCSMTFLYLFSTHWLTQMTEKYEDRNEANISNRLLMVYQMNSWKTGWIKVFVSVREQRRVTMRYRHIACSSRLEEGMKHAALITIFIHQPVSEADSLFISSFTAVSCSLVDRKQTENHTIMSVQSTYFGAPVGNPDQKVFFNTTWRGLWDLHTVTIKDWSAASTDNYQDKHFKCFNVVS